MLRALALALGFVPGLAGAEIVAARYGEPTTRYPHAVLGDDVEHAALEVTLDDGARQTLRWAADIVFEDTAPRLVDVSGDGAPEVIVVESHAAEGARLAVYGLVEGQLALRAATPFIGTRFRWLAPVGDGAADLDGDGAVEIAYVDRPHLAKTLRVWRYAEAGDTATLTPVADLPGVTNHRIGEADIGGGLRLCADAREMVLASADWRDVVAVRLEGGALVPRVVGPHTGRASLSVALGC